MITFDKRGGGERLIINLARALKADIYTGFADRKNTFDMSDLNVIEIGRRISNPLVRTVYLMEKFKRLDLTGKYDFFIFSGTLCISAARNRPNLLYLHTPPRHMYDLKEWFAKNSGIIGRAGLKLLHAYLYPRDQNYMRQFDVICPNSENVALRVKKFYGRRLYKKCKVVYTGIETKKFYCKSGEFFLSVSRLDPLKRIDVMINAFKEMPGETLYITSSGPEEAHLKKMAEGHGNIKFLGPVSEEKLLDLYARCKAVISANIDEDLGLSAIECQAAGKPAITVREGGFVETTVENKTGLFFQPDKDSLIAAIRKFKSIQWNRNVIRKNAKNYDISTFVKRIKNVISETRK
ncbi:MAG: glycosyltransferase [Candidatus Aenigmarchaeota archaeon]|nr:glycosyltransferase [Candidatus Aenigmarchaeota archaeon]